MLQFIFLGGEQSDLFLSLFQLTLLHTEGMQTWSFSAAVFFDSLCGQFRILVPL